MPASVILAITKQILLNKRPPLLYRIIQLLTAPFVAWFFAVRWVTRVDYRSHFGERLGFLPATFSRTKPGSIWVHAVSVGEVASALPLLKEIRATFAGVPVYLSVSTVAGRKAADRQAADLVDKVFYLPIDYAAFIRRALRLVRPALVVILETEIWPNFYFETVQTGARLAIVNGRISNRTWPHYWAARWFFAPVLQLPHLVLVQSELDLERYKMLGVTESKIALGGNLKYDAASLAKPVFLPTFGADQVWIAASTVGPNERGSLQKHEIDEDDLVLDAFEKLARLFPKLLLILAPRQPDRFPPVFKKLQSRGLSFLRRSAVTVSSELSLPGIVLLDSIGELSGLYSRANVVFVGGSIAPRGGHNILEPAAAGAAIVTGEYMQNFETIARDFQSGGACVQVKDGSELCAQVQALLSDPLKARRMGEQARQLVAVRRGVASTVVKQLEPLFYEASLSRPRGSMMRLGLSPLARLWEWGGKHKRGHSEQQAATLRSIPVPVLSIGGITVGGSGKTPFANYLTQALQRSGFSPAIVTRGYRRRYPAEHLVFAPGVKVSPFFTGDEAQIFLRAAIAPIGIGNRRYETAQILLRQFPDTNVILLDDGFQHALIDRDLDIVIIDGIDPFGQEEAMPLGRLREPLTALRRADVFVVMRAESDQRFKAIQKRLAEWNQQAPVFRSRLKPVAWRDGQAGKDLGDLTGRKIAAFCGLGNPQNFWNTLEAMNLQPVLRWEFEDHHVYKPIELSRLAHQAKLHGAEILVTTEKDRINCPPQLESLVQPLTLAWLEIEISVDDEKDFLAFITNRMAPQ